MNTNLLESTQKEAITEEDIKLLKRYLKEKKEPILLTYQINGIERKAAIVLSDESKYLSLGYVAIQVDKIWSAIKDKKTLQEQKEEFLKYLQEVEELISLSSKVKEIFDNKAEVRILSLFPDLE
jgi:galactokinase/mevalonate kinase-like predicted kinase